MSLKDLNAKFARLNAQREGASVVPPADIAKPISTQPSEPNVVEAKVEVVTPKEVGRESRAGGRMPFVQALNDGKQSKAVNKILRKAVNLVDLMGEQDLVDDVRVLREAKNATHRQFNVVTKEWVVVPDHKTRLAATTLTRAYLEGLPVARQLQVTGELGGDQMIELAKASPQLRAHLAGLLGVQESGGSAECSTPEKTDRQSG